MQSCNEDIKIMRHDLCSKGAHSLMGHREVNKSQQKYNQCRHINMSSVSYWHRGGSTSFYVGYVTISQHAKIQQAKHMEKGGSNL